MIGNEGKDHISLGFVGDVCLSLEVIDVVRNHGAEFVFDGIRPLLDGLDFTVANLECCIVESVGDATRPRRALDVPRDVADTILHSGIDVFGLANNHILDRGASGLESTLDYLNGNNVRHFGAGMRLGEAEAACNVEIAGRRIALLGACDVTACWAREAMAGVAPFSARRLVRRVAAAKREADLVIAVLHADLEFVRHPAPYRQRLSRRLIDSGADLVIEHHPHVCQGIERYRHGLIAYSLGNSVFQVIDSEYQESHPGTCDSMLFQVDAIFGGDHPRLNPTVHPLVIDRHHRPVPPEPNAGTDQIERIERLSREVVDERAVRKAWRRVCRRKIRDHIFDTYYALRRDGLGGAIRTQAALFRKPENRHWILGFLSAGFY